MNVWERLVDKIKPNALYLATGSGVLAAGTLAVLCLGPVGIAAITMGTEIQLLLATAFGMSLASTIGLAAQVAQDPAPNPHQSHLDHEYRMAQLEKGNDA